MVKYNLLKTAIMILTMIINLAWFSNSFSRTAIDSLSVTLDQYLAAPESQFLNPLSEQAVIDSALKNSRKLQFFVPISVQGYLKCF